MSFGKLNAVKIVTPLARPSHAIDHVLPEQQQRVKISKSVNDTRERLTSTTGTRKEFDYGLLKTFADSHITASIAVTLIALTATGALLYSIMTLAHFEAFTMIIGAIAGIFVLVILMINSFFAKNFTNLRSNEVNIASKTMQFIALDTLYGLAWAFFIFAIYITEIRADSFIVIAALMIISGATMSSSALPKAVLGATLPIALSLAVYFAMRQTLEGVMLAIGVLCAESFFLFVAGRFYKANLSGLVANADKESLLADLEIAKIQSDEARREAENANVAKSRFLAQMSHELRTPLNAILGFSEVIKDEMFGKLGVPAYKEYANDIHSSGQHLLSLINEILDLSRIESGKQELQEDSVTLSYIAEDAVHLLRVRAKNKGVEIVEQYEEEMPKLWADERAIRQIILNVMSNAIKFTPANGSVTVKIGWTASGGQYISVRDTGMGIPEDEIQEVLSNFGQGSNAMKSAEAGTGLGLPIVQGLVQMHGGTFTLKSKVGVGTEVISTFPATRVMETLGQIKSPSIAPPIENKILKRINIRKEVSTSA